MNSVLFLLFVPPLLVVLGMKLIFHKTITPLEMLIQGAAALILVFSIWHLSRYSQMQDVLLLNGKVTGKDQVSVSCSHDYSCNCKQVTSGSGKDRTTRTVCETCQEHSNDWDWRVYSTLGTIEIDRVDRRGSDMPERWSTVKTGESVAVEQTHPNYVKAVPSSLFNPTKAETYKKALPSYPRVYDYYRVRHAIAMPGSGVTEIDTWNALLGDKLNDLGAKKQVNILLVFTGESPVFAEALKAKWLGGKKNDVLVVIGTAYPKIRWVRVFSWSKRDMVNVTIRNDLLESKTLSPQTTVDVVTQNVAKYYQRKPMAEFEYLKDEIEPSTGMIIFIVILSILCSVGLGILFHHGDLIDRHPKWRR